MPVFCVVTDTDIHRVWAPLDGDRSRVRYLVPATVTLRQAGMDVEVPVEAVRRGDLVITLDPKTYQAQVDQAAAATRMSAPEGLIGP